MHHILQKKAIRLSTVRSFPRYSCSKLVTQFTFSSSSSSQDGPLKEYHRLVASGTISEDSHQLAALAKLQRLYEQIVELDGNVSPRSSSVTQTTTATDVGNHSATQSSASSMSVGSMFQSWFGGTSTSTSSSQQSTTSSSSLFSSTTSSSSVRGLYMWGGTGCGKTFIMDLFFTSLPIHRKRRVHFNNFMIDIHKRLHRLKTTQDATTPSHTAGASSLRSLRRAAAATTGSSATGGAVNAMIEQVTEDLMTEAYLLCFDEFQVTDIADAMILKSLFEVLFHKGAIVIATSNRPPQDLYKHGLQRSLFLPFITLLEKATEVHSLIDSMVDYRIVKASSGTSTASSSSSSSSSLSTAVNQQDDHLHDLRSYFTPVTTDHEKAFRTQFLRHSPIIASTTSTSTVPASSSLISLPSSSLTSLPLSSRRLSPVVDVALSVYGHTMRVPQAMPGRAVALFDFKDLCDEALGAADYIYLAESFRVIYLAHVPVLTLASRNEMRRFITLVDALYEGHVSLVLLAEAQPTLLLHLSEEEKASCPFDEIFAFDRTVSRLLEMQSEPYKVAVRTNTLLNTRDLDNGQGQGNDKGKGQSQGCVYRHLMAACALVPVDTSPYTTTINHTTNNNTETTTTTTSSSLSLSQHQPQHPHQPRHVKVRALLSLLMDQRLKLPGDAVVMAHAALTLNHHSNNNDDNDDDHAIDNNRVSSSPPSSSSLPSSSSSLSSRLLGGLYIIWVSYNWGRGRGDTEGSLDATPSPMPLPCAQVLLADLQEAHQYLIATTTHTGVDGTVGGSVTAGGGLTVSQLSSAIQRLELILSSSSSLSSSGTIGFGQLVEAFQEA